MPTEAELACREGRDYEPASVLLQRIRTERQAKEAAAGGRKVRGGRGDLRSKERRGRETRAER